MYTPQASCKCTFTYDGCRGLLESVCFMVSRLGLLDSVAQVGQVPRPTARPQQYASDALALWSSSAYRGHLRCNRTCLDNTMHNIPL